MDGDSCSHSSYIKLVTFIVTLGCFPCGIAVYWEHVYLFMRAPHLSTPLFFVVAVTIGSGIAAILLPGVGRRRPLVYGELSFIPALIINALYQGHHPLDFLARLFAGVGVGVYLTAAIVYVGEVTLPKYRARHYAILALLYWLGAFVYTLLYQLDPWFSLVALVVPVVVFVLGVIFLPETPYYVTQLGCRHFAGEVLYFLRCGPARCYEWELAQVCAFVCDHACECYSWSVLDRCLTILLLVIFTHFTGFLAFMLGTYGIAYYITYPVLVLVLLLGFLAYYIMVKRIARWTVMFISLLGTLLCSILVMTYYALDRIALLLYIVLPLFYFCYFLGTGEMFFLLAGEVFPYKVKHHFVCFAVIAYFLTLSFSGFMARELYIALGPFLMSLYFVVHNLLGLIFALFVMPGYEPDASFVEIQMYFDRPRDM